jgi:hypothetical protein
VAVPIFYWSVLADHIIIIGCTLVRVQCLHLICHIDICTYIHTYILLLLLLLLPWYYSPRWALTSFTMHPHSIFLRFILRFRDNNSCLVCSCQPHAQHPTWRTRPLYYLYPPEPGWPSYTSKHQVPILVASYNTHGLQWDYSYSPVTTQGMYIHYRTQKCISSFFTDAPHTNTGDA